MAVVINGHTFLEKLLKDDLQKESWAVDDEVVINDFSMIQRGHTVIKNVFFNKALIFENLDLLNGLFFEDCDFKLGVF